MSDRNEENLPDDPTGEGPSPAASAEELESQAVEAREEKSQKGGTADPATRTLGLERYVQFGFIAFAGVLFWILDKLITTGWEAIAEQSPTIPVPNTFAITLISFALGAAIAFVCSRQPKLHKLANEVAVELSKVTWPTKAETYAATVVVIVTSVIAAILVGSFDFVWSYLTNKLHAM